MRVSIAASRRPRLGEAAGLTGVDLDEGNAGRAQAALEGEMIGTGRLEDDALDRRLREPLHERPMSALVVGEAPARAVGQAMSVEMVFRHIDADGIILPSFRAFVRMAMFLTLLHRWESAELNQEEAAELLGVSERTFRRWTRREV